MIRVRYTIVGMMPGSRGGEMELEALPRESEQVVLMLPGRDPIESASLFVRTVIHYPQGEDGDRSPFVYLVLGPPRP